ncbi:type II toxin-antitoxin system HicA family toxin [Geminocystis sp. CENA526]|uniref:type II toxin-antitoxin system HicA family toxin n=1 Tax=Geminocystis sp. CENA526 TaxID=1355871 RepID=UPI003D6E24C2
MPKLTPVSWKELVTKLNELGFESPFSGGKHPQMRRGNVTLIIPNPHKKEISIGLLQRILRQGNISREEWLQ